MSDPTLDDYRASLAEAAAAEGMRSAGAAADPDEFADELEWIRQRARMGWTQCACDARRDSGLPAGALGPLFRRAEGLGYIRFAGYHRARSISRHGSPHGIWNPGDAS